MPEKEKKETPLQTQQTQAHATSQGQYTPDKTLRRVCLEKADKPEEKRNER